MKILNEKKYKFQCRQCYTEILFSKKDCWVDRTYEDFWLTCPVCGRRHDNQTYGLFRQEYIEEYDEKDKEIERLKSRLEEYQEYVEINHKEIERLNNIINELEKWLEQEYAVVKANSLQEPNNPEWYIKWNERKNTLDKLQELKGVDKE